jgi:hypothetical protein
VFFSVCCFLRHFLVTFRLIFVGTVVTDIELSPFIQPFSFIFVSLPILCPVTLIWKFIRPSLTPTRLTQLRLLPVLILYVIELFLTPFSPLFHITAYSFPFPISFVSSIYLIFNLYISPLLSVLLLQLLNSTD